MIKKLICKLVGHQWEFKLINQEGEKVFVCERCFKEYYD